MVRTTNISTKVFNKILREQKMCAQKVIYFVYCAELTRRDSALDALTQIFLTEKNIIYAMLRRKYAFFTCTLSNK